MQEKREVVMLSTEKASILTLHIKDNKLALYQGLNYDAFSNGVFSNQHLYILSDEKIKTDDWFIECIDNGSIGAPHYSIDKMVNPQYSIEEVTYSAIDINGNKFTCGYHNSKKIIATTNPELKFTNHRISPVPNFMELPQISQDFVEAYIKAYNEGNSIKEVMVEYEEYHGINTSLTEISSYNNDAKDYGKDYKLRLRPDNTIIINRIKEKKYSRAEVITIAWEMRAFYHLNKDIPNNRLRDKFKDFFNEEYPE